MSLKFTSLNIRPLNTEDNIIILSYIDSVDTLLNDAKKKNSSKIIINSTKQSKNYD